MAAVGGSRKPASRVCPLIKGDSHHELRHLSLLHPHPSREEVEFGALPPPPAHRCATWRPEQRRACFPLVDESEWCGEYRASETVDGPTNRELMLDILATLRELTKPETKEN